MKNRIFTIMEHSGKTATEFADTLGISRAALSSIKTGRTQPTLIMVERIHDKFPEVSLEWLITGRGDMLSGISHSQQPDLFSSSDVKPEEPAPYTPPNASAVTTIQKQNGKKEQEPATASGTDNPHTGLAKVDRKIYRIILLYDDGSFDEYMK